MNTTRVVEFEAVSCFAGSRRVRAGQIAAMKRSWERNHGVTLLKASVRRSETFGFAHSTIIRYIEA